MWNPQHLTTLKASRACYGDSFTFTLTLKKNVPPKLYHKKQGAAKRPPPFQTAVTNK
jgi:hypothetical protein